MEFWEDVFEVYVREKKMEDVGLILLLVVMQMVLSIWKNLITLRRRIEVSYLDFLMKLHVFRRRYFFLEIH